MAIVQGWGNVGATAGYVDTNFGVIPDFIANYGMARAFNYLMSNKVNLNAGKIFEDISQTIYNAMDKVQIASTSKTKRATTALKTVFKKLMN